MPVPSAYSNHPPEVKEFFNNCYAYAVYPTVGKAAVLVGGAFGEGKVYRGGKVVGTSKMMQASFGLQLGCKAFSEIVFPAGQAGL